MSRKYILVTVLTIISLVHFMGIPYGLGYIEGVGSVSLFSKISYLPIIILIIPSIAYFLIGLFFIFHKNFNPIKKNFLMILSGVVLLGLSTPSIFNELFELNVIGLSGIKALMSYDTNYFFNRFFTIRFLMAIVGFVIGGVLIRKGNSFTFFKK